MPIQIKKEEKENQEYVNFMKEASKLQETNRQNLKRSLTKQIAEAEEAGEMQKSKKLLIQYQELLNEE